MIVDSNRDNERTESEEFIEVNLAEITKRHNNYNYKKTTIKIPPTPTPTNSRIDNSRTTIVKLATTTRSRMAELKDKLIGTKHQILEPVITEVDLVTRLMNAES